jgi:hypothetical protein
MFDLLYPEQHRASITPVSESTDAEVGKAGTASDPTPSVLLREHDRRKAINGCRKVIDGYVPMRPLMRKQPKGPQGFLGFSVYIRIIAA